MGESMKSYWFAAVAAVALVSAGAANANEELAKKSACMACHKVDGKLVGPGYKDIAKKYAGDAGAEAKLIAKVKGGGSGVWGAIPMPPNAAIADADVKALVKWILAMK
jgi:cytochrome c